MLVETPSLRKMYSGFDKVDYTGALESVRATLMEEKRAGAVDFFIGADLNTEPTLDIADDEHQGLDRIECYGMYGLECKGDGEVVVACEQKLRCYNNCKTSTAP